MQRFAQIGLMIAILGIVIAVMGLFPGLTGADDTTGVGLIQVLMLILGYGLLVFGAIIYAKYTYFPGLESTLFQQIGIRLAITGIVFAAIAGLSDIMGFGSHVRADDNDIFFGQLQAFGILASFALSSIGVMIYVVTGRISGETYSDDVEDI